MEILEKAKIIRLRNLYGKYLVAGDDEKSVHQDRNGNQINAHWTVELAEGQQFVRLKSCYGKYLTASNMPLCFLRLMGQQIVQTLPSRRDSATEWEVESDGHRILLKTRYGHFLRSHGIWIPPFRNLVSHDIPYRTRTLQKIKWEVDIVESSGTHRRSQSEPVYNNVVFQTNSI